MRSQQMLHLLQFTLSLSSWLGGYDFFSFPTPVKGFQ